MYGETETKEIKETLETVETSGGTCKYYTKLYEETERPKVTKETVETNDDTCNYKTVLRDGERQRLKRLWRPVEIHANTK